MKSQNIEIVSSLFENPLKFLKFGSPQVCENMTVIPIIIQEINFVDFITIQEAEQLGVVEITETDTVSQLEVINRSDKPVLIPFGMTVHGGKQDRTIWEPILLPIGGRPDIFKEASPKTKQKYIIPAKCIEQSRWNYKGDRKFKASNTRLHPNVAFEAISAAGQSAVWEEIQSHRSEMNYALAIAPTQSYLEMKEVSEKQTKNIIKNFKSLKGQCGIAVFINNEFIGIEFYANIEAWKYMSNDIFEAFSMEALRFKEKPIEKKSVKYYDELMTMLRNLKFKFSSREGVGIGNVVEFNTDDNKWRGITLVNDGIMVQFYLVSKRGGYQGQGQMRPNVQFQTIINQRYTI